MAFQINLGVSSLSCIDSFVLQKKISWRLAIMKVLSKNFEFWRIFDMCQLWQIHVPTLTTEDDMSKRAVAEQVVDKAQLFGAAETFSAITGRPSLQCCLFQGLDDETCRSCDVWKRGGSRQVRTWRLLLPSLSLNPLGETRVERGHSQISSRNRKMREQRVPWTWVKLTAFGVRASRGVDFQRRSGWEQVGQKKGLLWTRPLQEVLHDHSALGYLIQYLEARDAAQVSFPSPNLLFMIIILTVASIFHHYHLHM